MKQLTVANYVYINYTKGEFPRFEIEMNFAERAVEAILDGSLSLLSKPIAVYLRSGEYNYDAESVAALCCKLGITDFVHRMICAVDRLRTEQIEEMLDKITMETYARQSLLLRIAAAIELCNPRFLMGPLGLIREEQLQELLVKSGIAGYVRMALDD
ncbi:MAG: hypothetical protein J6M02_01180 [Clostridia bacterium]|nr:hypothetical protein [Clostridia bacterium]